jgi:hypothetical protein
MLNRDTSVCDKFYWSQLTVNIDIALYMVAHWSHYSDLPALTEIHQLVNANVCWLCGLEQE